MLEYEKAVMHLLEVYDSHKKELAMLTIIHEFHSGVIGVMAGSMAYALSNGEYTHEERHSTCCTIEQLTTIREHMNKLFTITMTLEQAIKTLQYIVSEHREKE